MLQWEMGVPVRGVQDSHRTSLHNLRIRVPEKQPGSRSHRRLPGRIGYRSEPVDRYWALCERCSHNSQVDRGVMCLLSGGLYWVCSSLRIVQMIVIRILDLSLQNDRNIETLKSR